MVRYNGLIDPCSGRSRFRAQSIAKGTCGAIENKTSIGGVFLAASSKSTSVPVIFVSINCSLVWLCTCGLCNVAEWRMCLTGLVAKTEEMKLRSLTDPTCVVVGDSRISMPIGVNPKTGRESINAAPKWPADPVTTILQGITEPGRDDTQGRWVKRSDVLFSCSNTLAIRNLRATRARALCQRVKARAR